MALSRVERPVILDRKEEVSWVMQDNGGFRNDVDSLLNLIGLQCVWRKYSRE